MASAKSPAAPEHTMPPTASYLLLMHAQLGHVPPEEDGKADELFIPRRLRTSLTAEADAPSRRGIPQCVACAVHIAVHGNALRVRLVFEDCTWRFVKASTE